MEEVSIPPITWSTTTFVMAYGVVPKGAKKWNSIKFDQVVTNAFIELVLIEFGGISTEGLGIPGLDKFES